MAATTGTPFELLTGDDLLDPPLQAKKLQMTMHRRFDRPARAARTVAMDQGERLESLPAAGRNFSLQPVQSLLHQRHALFQVDHPMQQSGGAGRARTAFGQAKGALRLSGLDLIAADLADQVDHRLALSAQIAHPAALPAADLDHLRHLQEMLLQDLQVFEIDHIKQDIELGNIFHRRAGVQFDDIGIVGTDGGADFGQQALAVFRPDLQ